MSDGSLSQDEIDALLQGGGSDFGGSSGGPGASGGTDKAGPFGEIINGITDQIASNLTNLVGKNVTIGVPLVETVDRDGLLASLQDEVVDVKLDYSEGISGNHSFIFPQQIATSIAGMMMGQDGVELNEAALSALEEACNTMAGNTATVFGDKIGSTVMTSPAQTQKALKASIKAPPGSFIKVSYPITIEGEAPAEFYELYGMPVVDSLIGNGGSGGGMDFMGDMMNGFQQSGGGQQQVNFGGGMPNMGGGMPNMGGMNLQQANVQSVQFPNLMPQSSAGDQGNIGLLMDVYMEMTVELGRTRRQIREILGMGEGTIIELDKLAGEPVDILVNHKLIAKGEVVVIDENFGVRVTEIVSPMDRVGDI